MRLRDVKARLSSMDGTEALIEGFGASSGRAPRAHVGGRRWRLARPEGRPRDRVAVGALDSPERAAKTGRFLAVIRVNRSLSGVPPHRPDSGGRRVTPRGAACFGGLAPLARCGSGPSTGRYGHSLRSGVKRAPLERDPRPRGGYAIAACGDKMARKVQESREQGRGEGKGAADQGSRSPGKGSRRRARYTAAAARPLRRRRQEDDQGRQEARLRHLRAAQRRDALGGGHLRADRRHPGDDQRDGHQRRGDRGGRHRGGRGRPRRGGRRRRGRTAANWSRPRPSRSPPSREEGADRTHRRSGAHVSARDGLGRTACRARAKSPSPSASRPAARR